MYRCIHIHRCMYVCMYVWVYIYIYAVVLTRVPVCKVIHRYTCCLSQRLGRQDAIPFTPTLECHFNPRATVGRK